jgi:hypothetical protein
MHRYYMTPETRQAVIAESNRLIANRAAASAARSRLAPGTGAEPDDGDALAAQAGRDDGETDSESAFARLVADLQSSAGSAFGAPASATNR